VFSTNRRAGIYCILRMYVRKLDTKNSERHYPWQAAQPAYRAFTLWELDRCGLVQEDTSERVLVLTVIRNNSCRSLSEPEQEIIYHRTHIHQGDYQIILHLIMYTRRSKVFT
jgi:hypothetical protein